MRPVLLVIAGPNGAGKTTLTERLRRDRWSEGVEYLNPDEIARDRFVDWNSVQAVMDAARWTAARRDELLEAGAGIAFETVFSTDEKVEFLAPATPDTSSIEKILSRYERSMANLTAAIALADRVYIYDNSIDGVEATLCARTVDGQLRKVYVELPAWVEASVVDLDRHGDFAAPAS
jgi:predicted ABC-type ATPase